MRAVAHRGPTSGLTLLELMAALAVLAVLCALAVPSLGARLQRQRLQFAAQSLAADVAEARFEAAQQGRRLLLETKPGPAWCWAITTTPGCGCGQALACQLRRVTGADHPGVQMTLGQTTRLEADGSASPGPAAEFAAVGLQLRVNVSVAGRAHLCAPDKTWPGMARC
jgi:type IV fimbrial biogenesis protein FimT